MGKRETEGPALLQPGKPTVNTIGLVLEVRIPHWSSTFLFMIKSKMKHFNMFITYTVQRHYYHLRAT